MLLSAVMWPFAGPQTTAEFYVTVFLHFLSCVAERCVAYLLRRCVSLEFRLKRRQTSKDIAVILYMLCTCCVADKNLTITACCHDVLSIERRH